MGCLCHSIKKLISCMIFLVCHDVSYNHYIDYCHIDPYSDQAEMDNSEAITSTIFVLNIQAL